MAQTSAGATLEEVTLTHRRADVRVASIQALLSCRTQSTATAVRARLGDLDPSVRSAAATALGELRDRESIEPLFRALDLQIYEAAGALARLVTGDAITQLTGYVGRMPFDVMTPALSELLARDDVSERIKLNLIAQLQELGTAEAKIFLEDLGDSIPRNGPDARLRQAALDAALRIVD
jgi:HEAT repeat protein